MSFLRAAFAVTLRYTDLSSSLTICCECTEAFDPLMNWDKYFRFIFLSSKIRHWSIIPWLSISLAICNVQSRMVFGIDVDVEVLRCMSWIFWYSQILLRTISELKRIKPIFFHTLQIVTFVKVFFLIVWNSTKNCNLPNWTSLNCTMGSIAWVW